MCYVKESTMGKLIVRVGAGDKLQARDLVKRD